MASDDASKMLKIVSENFLGAFKYSTFLKTKNIDWCISKTVQIEREATHLKMCPF